MLVPFGVDYGGLYGHDLFGVTCSRESQPIETGVLS
jgi:hypothetical protein